MCKYQAKGRTTENEWEFYCNYDGKDNPEEQKICNYQIGQYPDFGCPYDNENLKKSRLEFFWDAIMEKTRFLLEKGSGG